MQNVSESFILDPLNGSHHCCYVHERMNFESGEWEIFWCGVCRLSDVVTAPDARQNTAWLAIMQQEPRPTVRTTVIAISDNPYECQNKRRAVRAKQRPVCNMTGERMTRLMKVQCIETQEIFNSATEAAKSVGAAQSNMSNHLGGKVGFRTVKGYTFRYYAEEAG